jgi:hypothetical protein
MRRQQIQNIHQDNDRDIYEIIADHIYDTESFDILTNTSEEIQKISITPPLSETETTAIKNWKKDADLAERLISEIVSSYEWIANKYPKGEFENEMPKEFKELNRKSEIALLTLITEIKSEPYFGEVLKSLDKIDLKLLKNINFEESEVDIIAESRPELLILNPEFTSNEDVKTKAFNNLLENNLVFLVRQLNNLSDEQINNVVDKAIEDKNNPALVRLFNYALDNKNIEIVKKLYDPITENNNHFKSLALHKALMQAIEEDFELFSDSELKNKFLVSSSAPGMTVQLGLDVDKLSNLLDNNYTRDILLNLSLSSKDVSKAFLTYPKELIRQENLNSISMEAEEYIFRLANTTEDTSKTYLNNILKYSDVESINKTEILINLLKSESNFDMRKHALTDISDEFNSLEDGEIKTRLLETAIAVSSEDKYLRDNLEENEAKEYLNQLSAYSGYIKKLRETQTGTSIFLNNIDKILDDKDLSPMKKIDQIKSFSELYYKAHIGGELEPLESVMERDIREAKSSFLEGLDLKSQQQEESQGKG